MTTERKKRKFLQIFEKKGCNISATCKSLKIARTTFYRWYRDDEEFKKQVDDARENLIDEVEDILLSKIREGDTTCIIFFLKTRGKNRGYSERQEVEHRVKDSQIKIYLPQKDDN